MVFRGFICTCCKPHPSVSRAHPPGLVSAASLATAQDKQPVKKKTAKKDAPPRVKTPAELEAESLHIELKILFPAMFRIHYEDLYLNFDALYFRRSEVEAIEQAYPECLITNIRDRDADSLYTTTEKNIAGVGAMALINMVTGPALPVHHSASFRDGLHSPDSWWDNGKRDQESFSLMYFLTLMEEFIWPNIPIDMPERPKKSRTTDLDDIKPTIAALKPLGIREDEKFAKITYSLFPFLSYEEIGALFPAKPGSTRSRATDRDRGRVLLGMKPPRKPPQRGGGATT